MSKNNATCLSVVNITFQVINIVLGVLVILIGIMGVGFGQYFNVDVGGLPLFASWSVHSVIISIYVIGFGFVMIFVALVAPEPALKYVRFMYTWLGRGLFFIFVGCLVAAQTLFNLITAALVIICGIVYCILGILSACKVVGEPVALLALCGGGGKTPKTQSAKIVPQSRTMTHQRA